MSDQRNVFCHKDILGCSVAINQPVFKLLQWPTALQLQQHACLACLQGEEGGKPKRPSLLLPPARMFLEFLLIRQSILSRYPFDTVAFPPAFVPGAAEFFHSVCLVHCKLLV